jgi:hypothetical protein
MYGAAHRITERAVNHLMTLQEPFASKLGTDDERFKMRVVVAVYIYTAALQAGSDQLFNFSRCHKKVWRITRNLKNTGAVPAVILAESLPDGRMSIDAIDKLRARFTMHLLRIAYNPLVAQNRHSRINTAVAKTFCANHALIVCSTSTQREYHA